MGTQMDLKQSCNKVKKTVSTELSKFMREVSVDDFGSGAFIYVFETTDEHATMDDIVGVDEASIGESVKMGIEEKCPGVGRFCVFGVQAFRRKDHVILRVQIVVE